VGGGIVLVPALAVLFEAQGIAPEATLHLALGTSLGTIVFTSLSSTRAHQRRKTVDWSIVKAITPGIVLGTFLGGFVAARLSTSYLKTFFAVFLLAVSVQLFTGARPHAARTLPKSWGLSGVGLAIGGLSGLVGIGGGSMSVPFMLFCNVDTRRAIGTSAAIGFPIALAGSLSYLVNGLSASTGVPYTLGYLHLPALVCVAALSMTTAPLGAKLATMLEPTRLKRGFSVFLMLMAARMLWTALAR
jgi:uncharacterized membrane protein YfcA